MDQQRGGKGRARGRARDSTQEGAPRPGPARGPPPGMAAPRPGGAWGTGPPMRSAPPPQQQQQYGGVPAQVQPVVAQAAAWGPRQQAQHQIRAPQPQPAATQLGRASYRGTGDAPTPGAPAEHQGRVAGGGGDAAALGVQHSGRGAVRGGRVLHEDTIRTRLESSNKKGTTGRAVTLSANYFKLIQQPNWCLYQYRVDFAPDEDRTLFRKRLLRVAVATLKLSGYIFDGTVLYTPRRLVPDPMELVVDSAVEGGERVRITIRLVGDVTMGDYHYLQIFNMIMRKCMGHLQLQLVGRNFFDALARISVPAHNLELWPGYVTSIRQHEQNILMCCEITHKVMRMETVYNLLTQCSQEDRTDYKKKFQEKIIGCVVLTDYNNKTYHIDDVDFETTPGSSFQMKDGTAVVYAQYFSQKYGLNIRNMEQPMLVSRSKPREIRAGMSETILLVPELCRLTGLTEQQRGNFQLMRALSDHTRVGPPQRIQKLHQFSHRLASNAEIMKELSVWDLQLAESIVQFQGRVLTTETILGGDSKYPAGREVDWTKELRSKKMFSVATCSQWVVMYPTRCKNAASAFLQMLNRAAQGMSWGIGPPKHYEMADDRANTYIQALETVTQKSQPDLILCIVTNNNSSRYSIIKKKCCVDKAIPTQVILAKNLDSKGAMTIATKVAIQMNCKLGGAPWTVSIPLKGLMVIGYDVCHDPQNKQKSYGAMVASIDKNITRYFSTASPHTSGEELSNHFQVDMIKALKAYQKFNNSFPERIIIYRDGVGDGQLNYVIEHEINGIKEILKSTIYKDTPLKMAFVIVSKRINTRVFADGKNPEPGTVVDDVITLPERYDFFIVSQCVRQGTVSPTSYNVIVSADSDIGLSADRLQILTYKLTHMYYNWSGTVRVPAPCQYAHKLAFLVAQSLHRSPNPELENLLYYL